MRAKLYKDYRGESAFAEATLRVGAVGRILNCYHRLTLGTNPIRKTRLTCRQYLVIGNGCRTQSPICNGDYREC